MELEILLQHLLPEELLDYFELVAVKETEEEVLSMYLDEKKVLPPELEKQQVVSHGFTDAVKIQDFPLRGKRVYLIVRRRKWKDTTTGKIYSRTWDITAKGTSYSKEFAAFLKEVFRQPRYK